MSKVISGHNKKIVKAEDNIPPCNCTSEEWLVGGFSQSLVNNFQCEGKDVAGWTSKASIGLPGNTFKDRYHDNTRSFKVSAFIRTHWVHTPGTSRGEESTLNSLGEYYQNKENIFQVSRCESCA